MRVSNRRFALTFIGNPPESWGSEGPRQSNDNIQLKTLSSQISTLSCQNKLRSMFTAVLFQKVTAPRQLAVLESLTNHSVKDY